MRGIVCVDGLKLGRNEIYISGGKQKEASQCIQLIRDESNKRSTLPVPVYGAALGFLVNRFSSSLFSFSRRGHP